jgi:hypothetical protein
MLAALLFAAARVRQAPRRAPVALPAEAPPPAAPIAPLALRPSPRVAVQTSAALLAIALALDVSTPVPSFAAPGADGVYAAPAQDLYVLPEIDAQAPAWTPVELAPDWAYRAINATDGWLI